MSKQIRTQSEKASRKVCNELELGILNAIEAVRVKYKILYETEINYVLLKFLNDNVSGDLLDIFKNKEGEKRLKI